MGPRSWRWHLVVAVVYLVGWTLLDLVAQRFQAAPDVSVWYPPPALDLAMLLVLGLRYAVLLPLNTLIHVTLVNPIGLDWAEVLAYGVVSTVSYAGAAWVLSRRLRIDPRLRHQRDTTWFVALGCGAAPLVAATGQVAVLVQAGIVPREDGLISVAGLWAGSATGVGMLAPVLLVASRRWTRLWGDAAPSPPDLPGLRVTRRETAAQFALLVLATAVAYSPRAPGGSLDYTYLVYVPLIWIAVRGGLRPAAVAVLVISVVAAVANGGRIPSQGGIALQFGLVTVTLVGLLLGALITQRRLDSETHRHAALHDPLTGLANRELFADRVTHALQRGDRHPQDHYAVVFLDLDRFKDVNDSLGHAAGDTVLVGVAERLRRITRAQDTLGRFGGDEFALLVEDLSGLPDLTHLAERILHELGQPYVVEGHDVVVPASLGSVLVSGDGRRPEDLLRDADVALHQAKRSGRGRHVVFDPDMQRQAVESLRIESELRAAVATGTLDVVFQPIRSLEDGRLVAAEALARWPAGEAGRAVPPQVFVEVAEHSGLVSSLGAYVLSRACAAAAAWNGASAGVHLSVNTSPLELASRDYPRIVRSALAAASLPPERLVLEITERQELHQEDEVLRAVMAELAADGVRFVLDDFGAGNASLARLRALPLSGLKIDRSLVDALPDGREERSMVSGILALTQELDLWVTAEGVETPAQREFLRAAGCRYAQGFLLGRPAPGPPA